MRDGVQSRCKDIRQRKQKTGASVLQLPTLENAARIALWDTLGITGWVWLLGAQMDVVCKTKSDG